MSHASAESIITPPSIPLCLALGKEPSVIDSFGPAAQDSKNFMLILSRFHRDGVTQITSATSEPFEVFSPKLFRGMKESTPLTRHLASQGLKVKLRTDTNIGRQ